MNSLSDNMPFVQRQVYPVHLAGREIPESVENPLECVSNQTLCDAMRQLASLLKHADTMFSDLELNCGQISTRTLKLKDRLTVLDENVEKYIPKKEKIRKFKLYNEFYIVYIVYSQCFEIGLIEFWAERCHFFNK